MSRPDIYDQHDKAFSGVSAYVIMQGAERVATIAFKFPRDGASRLYAYVHWLGAEMQRGHAGGYGYDKKSAACANAAGKLTAPMDWDGTLNNGFGGYRPGSATFSKPHINFIRALCKDNGANWDGHLLEAGFEVLQAV